MEKKTIEQLLEMQSDERGQYLLALPEAERKLVTRDLLKAKAGKDLDGLVNNLNRNVLIEQLLEMSGKDLQAYLMALPEEERKIVDGQLSKAIPAHTLKKMVESLNSQTKADNP